MKVLIFNSPVPSDKRVPAFYSPCGRPPAQTGDRSFIDKGHVLEMLADDLSVPQIMMPMNEAVVERFEMGIPDRQESDRR